MSNILHWLGDNYKEIGIGIGTLIAAFKVGKEAYKGINNNIVKPSKELIRKIEYCYEQLRLNGGKTVKDLSLATNLEMQKLLEFMQTNTAWRAALVQELVTAIYECDAEGYLIYVNRSWCELTGMGNDDALGNAWKIIIHPDDLPVLERRGADYLKSGKSFNDTFRIVHFATKKEITVHATSTKIINAEGQVTSILGSLKPIN